MDITLAEQSLNIPLNMSYGDRLRKALEIRAGTPMPFIGIHDAFSAGIVANVGYDAIFLSGFGFSASYYGLPDIGFISWSDIVSYVQRIRTILPKHHILVDIDDGYCDVEVACHVVSLLEAAGASGVVLEDQKRPRKCGHLDGKQILELDDYLVKLKKVLATRRSNLFVVARTDSSDPEDIERRISSFAEAGADGLLVDGLKDMNLVRRLVDKFPKPFTFNQIAGGKSPPQTLTQLKEIGIKMVIYSTPCLFTAQQAITNALQNLQLTDGRLPTPNDTNGNPLEGPVKFVGVKECNELLHKNLASRDDKSPSSSP
jgi:2-methylisocitrate lyase-like PEP mutase family enzyme